MQVNENIILRPFDTTNSFLSKYAKAYGNIFRVKHSFKCPGCGDEILYLYGVNHGDSYSRCRFCHTALNGTCFSATRFDSHK